MFSIIVINYNTADLTIACLESILKHNSLDDLEIILIDNNSDTADLEKVRGRLDSRVRLFTNETNLGFARANNQGARLARGDYLFFLNSDTLIGEDIFTQLKASLALDASLGVLAPRLLLKSGAEQPYSYGLNRRNKVINWVSGAALVIRRDLFEKIDGWEEGFFMYFEDVDLCLRVKRAGYKIMRLDNVVVTHLVGGSPIPFWRRKYYYYRSKVFFILKNYLSLV